MSKTVGHHSAPELQILSDLDQAWETQGHGPRLLEIRRGAESLRKRIADGPRVLAVRTLPIATLVYPTRFAFWGMALSPAPYVVMTHRCLFVQFLQRGQVRHLLFNPSDDIGARATPFFARLAAQVGNNLAYNVLSTKFDTLETQLEGLGVTPNDIDYVAFDHFHTQDLRSLLGTTDGRPARFPNAKLLAPRCEWHDWDHLHPMQRAWFVADGKLGVNTDRVVLTDRDLSLGDGVMLLRTPGHTSGNQTLFLNTQSGVWGCSENGTCADNWAPLDSKIKGLRRAARLFDVDVVLNANTPEGGADQYTSMVLERTLVEPVSRAPAFCQMFPSSEITPSRLAPGLTPTLTFEKLESGEVTSPRR